MRAPAPTQTEVSAMTAARLTVARVAVLLAAGIAPTLRADPPAGATVIGTTQFRHVGWHSRVFFTDGGNTLLVAGEGVAVRWWDLETGKKLHEVTLKGTYDEAAFAPEADLLAVVGNHWPDGDNG